MTDLQYEVIAINASEIKKISSGLVDDIDALVEEIRLLKADNGRLRMLLNEANATLDKVLPP